MPEPNTSHADTLYKVLDEAEYVRVDKQTGMAYVWFGFNRVHVHDVSDPEWREVTTFKVTHRLKGGLYLNMVRAKINTRIDLAREVFAQ